MEYQYIVLDIENGIATLTLNRPEQMNAINNKMMSEELPDAFNRIERDDEIKVLILTGAGDRAFCTGADAKERLLTRMAGETIEPTRYEKVKAMGWIGEMLYRMPKPCIAAVNGIAAGAGVALTMLCDIRICSENARFGLIFVKRAIIPDCGSTYLLPRLVGTAKALELMWTGDIIDAREAERIGLANRVVAKDNLMDEAKKFAFRLAAGPSIAIELMKVGVRKAMNNDYEGQLDFESRAQQLCMKTNDFKEGVQSFFDKREPKFTGE